MSAPPDVAGRPAPLRRHTVLETSDSDAARDAVARVFLAHDLTSEDEHLRMTLNAVSDRHLTLWYLTYHASVRLDMPPTENSYIVNLTTSVATNASRSDGARERTTAGERGLVLSPARSASVRWTPRASVMTQLLHAARHQCTDALRAPTDGVRLGRLAPVVEYIEAHADEPLTPSQLARVGCMSVRTLHASFQHIFGESPMAYLRRTRLDHVRAELLRSDPASVLVTDVAMKWGFFHHSRFAQQYRRHFGELPSQTLRS